MAILKAIAEVKGISVTKFVKKEILTKIQEDRVNIALDLLKEGKISKKNAYKMSKLSYHEFMGMLFSKHIIENVPDEVFEKTFENAMNLDLSKYLKSEKAE